MLDTASGIGEALTKRPGRPDVQRRECDECRRAFRCTENGQAYRRRVLRHRGQGPVGRRAAATREDPAEDPAWRRASDRVSKRPWLKSALSKGMLANS